MRVILRAKRILIAPEEAWREIEREQLPALVVLVRYALPLAAIGPIAYALSAQLFTLPAPPVHWIWLVAAGIALNIATAMTIAAAALFVSSVSGGKREFGQALTLSCYSATALWITSAAVIFPDRALFAIVIFGGLLHSLYVFHLGFSMLLRVPHDATGMGTAVVITLTLAAFVALGWGLAYFV